MQLGFTEDDINVTGSRLMTYDNQCYYISCKFPVFSLVKERVPI